jgi:hypothetical protein
MMFQYDGNTGGFAKLGDYVEVVRSGDHSDGIRGKIGGWGDYQGLIALVALDEPMADGCTIVGWPIVCLKKVVQEAPGERWQRAFDSAIEEWEKTSVQDPRLGAKSFGNLCSESVAIDTDGYTIWKGGDYRPVDKDTIVAVKVRGKIPRDPVRAGAWPQICWMHLHKDDDMNKWDIVAYKVVK